MNVIDSGLCRVIASAHNSISFLCWWHFSTMVVCLVVVWFPSARYAYLSLLP